MITSALSQCHSQQQHSRAYIASWFFLSHFVLFSWLSNPITLDAYQAVSLYRLGVRSGVYNEIMSEVFNYNSQQMTK